MELIEDVKQGINMIHFLNTHPENFINSIYPFAVACLQTFGGLIAEAINLFMLSTRSSVADCITFYVAFRVLSSIDNIYAESLSDFVLKEAVEEPLIYERDHKKVPFSERTLLHKFIRITWRCLTIFQNTMYYYFVPLAVNFIPYIFPAMSDSAAAGGGVH